MEDLTHEANLFHDALLGALHMLHILVLAVGFHGDAGFSDIYAHYLHKFLGLKVLVQI
jgi:hypothetical protein